MPENYFGEPIHVYTVEDAIKDGVLVDTTAHSKEAGIRFRTVMSDHLCCNNFRVFLPTAKVSMVS